MIALSVLAIIMVGTFAYSLIGLWLERENIDFQTDYPSPYLERYAETRANASQARLRSFTEDHPLANKEKKNK